jgi:hypothetical protein
MMSCANGTFRLLVASEISTFKLDMGLAAWSSYIVTVSFIGRENVVPKKSNKLLHVTDRLSHTVVLSSIQWLRRTNHVYSEYTSQ